MKAKKTEKLTVLKTARKRTAKTRPEPIAAPSVNLTLVTGNTPRQVETPEPPSTPDPMATSLQAHLEQLRTGELASRIAAAAKLGEAGGPEAVLALQAALRDPTAEVAREAAVALGKAGVPSALEALAAVVENADNYYHCIVRTAAAESLALLKDRRAVKSLTLAVRDPFAEPSRAAIRALGAVAAEDATAVLQAVISNNDNYFLPSVRATAAEVLAAFPGPVAKDWLRSVANNPNEDPAVRQAALST